MNQHQFDPWSKNSIDFPGRGTFEEKARFLIQIATLAPSGHNTQPWVFMIGANTIDVVADRKRALPVVDPFDRELAISCGAAIGILEIAALQHALQPEVQYLPDAQNEDVLARITLSTNAGIERPDQALFDAVFDRRTTRLPFVDEPLSAEISKACLLAARGLNIELKLISNEETKTAVASLVAEGDRLQFDDPTFRRELASWVHSTRMGSRDGMSGTGFGMPDLLAPLGRFVIRTFDIGDSVAAGDEKKIVDHSPTIALIASGDDEVQDWIITGQALSKILLTVTSHGLTASYLNQPIETASLRNELKEVVGVNGVPQILLRIGRSSETPNPTVRRDVNDVIEQQML